ncbi:hypothetical protein V5799_013542, partial [Amblyomma americanum]
MPVTSYYLLTTFLAAIILTEISEQAMYRDVSAYKNEKCHYNGTVYNPDDTFYDTKQCVKYICIKENSTYGYVDGLT